MNVASLVHVGSVQIGENFRCVKKKNIIGGSNKGYKSFLASFSKKTTRKFSRVNDTKQRENYFNSGELI